MTGVNKILIAGGSGAIGRHLEDFLQKRDIDTCILSRDKSKADGSGVFYWNIENNEIDERCFDNVSHIIQLSGANISEKRWSAERKKEIINSRVDSTNLLFKYIKRNNIKLKAFVLASAVGYYGAVTSPDIHSESDMPGNDFLAHTCVLWENAAGQFSSTGIRTVKIRTGIVLMRHEGALKKLLTLYRFGIVTVLGSGSQYLPWIHIDDLCGIYYKAIIDDNQDGTYNAVAPSFTTNHDFIVAMKQVLNRPLFLVPIPEFILKASLGELSESIIRGNRISADKILSTGYNFIFDTPEKALTDLLKE